MKKVIIHPKDPSTEFLKILYPNEEAVTGEIGNGKMRKLLQSSNEIWLLGHGSNWGLLNMCSRFGILNVVGPEHVQFLRDKKVVGVFCNANEFAERYGLTGLFTGMIISEMSEALDWNIPTTEEELKQENILFASNLNNCIKYASDIKEVPEMMKSYIKETSSPLIRFNYESVFWIENGETIEKD